MRENILKEVLDYFLEPGESASHLEVSLHLHRPLGSQDEHEANYFGYERALVPRTAEAWEVSGAGRYTEVTNRIEIAFPQCTAAPGCPVRWVAVPSPQFPDWPLYTVMLDEPEWIGLAVGCFFLPGELVLSTQGVPDA